MGQWVAYGGVPRGGLALATISLNELRARARASVNFMLPASRPVGRPARRSRHRGGFRFANSEAREAPVLERRRFLRRLLIRFLRRFCADFCADSCADFCGSVSCESRVRASPRLGQPGRRGGAPGHGRLDTLQLLHVEARGQVGSCLIAIVPSHGLLATTGGRRVSAEHLSQPQARARCPWIRARCGSTPGPLSQWRPVWKRYGT
jgi:hypothetical protein